jgi:hypothetical protein
VAARFAAVNPSGGEDYTSFSAAESGEQTIGSNLVSAGDTLELQARGDWSAAADTTACTVNGFTTGASNWIKISTDSANRWNGGAWDATKARVIPASATPFIISDDFVTIEGLQLESTTVACVRSNNASTFVDNCHCRGRIGIETNNAASTIRVRNVLLTDSGANSMRRGLNAATSGSSIRGHAVTYTGTASSSTDPGYFAGTGATLTTNNCLFNDTAGSPVGWGGAGTHAGDYNASTDATATGANSIDNASFTFVNAGAGDFRIDASDTSGAIGGGADLSADANLPVTLDAGGQTRPSAPTIGMWEADPVVAGGGSPPIASFPSQRLARNVFPRRMRRAA